MKPQLRTYPSIAGLSTYQPEEMAASAEQSWQ